MGKRGYSAISDEEIKRQKVVMEEVKKYSLEGKQKFVYIETYGCQQNVADSERLSGMTETMGYIKTEDREKADLIIYNTCAVRENAELKVYGNLGALKHLKSKNEELIIAVCGCMMQEAHVVEHIRKKYKHVDIVFGTHTLYRFPELLLKKISDNERIIDILDIDGAVAEDIPLKRDNSISAWISIMYGCNNFCTYCIVPYVRGRERSRKKEDILNEIKKVAKEGYKEITLLGQNVNSYGKDLEDGIDFADLLSEAAKVEGIERIRFMTSHPKDISDKLLTVMSQNKNICNQLHLPLQSGSDEILKKMNRHYTKNEYLKIIEKARELMPDITVTTDIIVGFPGETNEDFEHTIDALEKARYDTIFSFIYSKRVGTPAASYPDVLSPEEKKKNFDRLLEVQNRISKEKNLEYEGKIYPVLVEGESKTDKDFLTGRTEGGKIVNFKGDQDMVGKIINIRITEAKTWSLLGEVQ